MKRTRKKPLRVGTETDRTLDFALADVSKDFRRRFLRHCKQYRREFSQQGTNHFKQRIKKLFCKTFLDTLLHAPTGKSAKQRNALAFILAAASVPRDLRLSGVPAELVQPRRRKRTK
ncbi:hypothetical protein PQR72_42805 [Paraburkholderia madseniana]|uniref:hypothetical protein n=1 Tax=Paraburkholderia madseniana TaxID=2599607 RepID=UPI0015C53BF2|nr:hypothetical protein [Paraburkholderia madseniana]NPT70788.1 hypothetical protein [Paraburkholderia madseniana]